ncbi:hypothetical protein ABIC63_002111 [Pseudacidovorax sp. 1753]|uniref:hypothetical protein n=1 Tax=Pseudacidovorax sp. 1753 TaxID=3156419 RepID=UPI0033991509
MTEPMLERHRCEVRMLIAANRDRARGREWVQNYLDSPAVNGRREQLRADLNDQIAKGNRGGEGEWL